MKLMHSMFSVAKSGDGQANRWDRMDRLMRPNPYRSPDHVGQQSDSPTTSGHGTKIGAIAAVVGIAFAVWTVAICDGISLFGLAIAGWVALPYLIISLAANRVSTLAAKVLLACTLPVLTLYGIRAFSFIDEDAQGGLILLFAPGYQLAGAILAAAIVMVIDRVIRLF